MTLNRCNHPENNLKTPTHTKRDFHSEYENGFFLRSSETLSGFNGSLSKANKKNDVHKFE